MAALLGAPAPESDVGVAVRLLLAAVADLLEEAADLSGEAEADHNAEDACEADARDPRVYDAGVDERPVPGEVDDPVVPDALLPLRAPGDDDGWYSPHI